MANDVSEWDPDKDPIVRVNNDTGEGYTKSGLVINMSTGSIVSGAKSPGGSVKVLGRSFANRATALNYFKKNPGWVGKNYKKLFNDKQGYGLMQAAGYYVKKNKKGVTTLHNNNLKGKTIWKWGVKQAPKAAIDSHPDESSVQHNPPGNIKKGRTQGYDKPGGPGAGGPTQEVDPVMAAIASLTGFDMKALQNLRTPKGVPLPLALAAKGAQVMGPGELDKLVSTIVGGQSQTKMIQSDIEQEKKQGTHNLAQIGRWYDQVLASQATAAERDKQFGQDAVQSATDVGQAILSSIGGEAAQGAGMVGASTAANVGNLQAIGTIQDQYNADVRPILEAEGAAAKTREQGASSARLRDLSKQLIMSQQQASADEANLRYQVWQQNNAILNNRIDRELGIRQYNAGLPQQQFANDIQKIQLAMAGQAQQFGQGLATAQAKAGVEDQRAQNAVAIARENRQAAKQAQGSWKPYATASAALKNSLRDEIGAVLSTPDGSARPNLSKKQAITMAAKIVADGYGWNFNNKAIKAMVMSIIADLGYE